MTLTRKDYEELADHVGMALHEMDYAAAHSRVPLLSALQESILLRHVVASCKTMNPRFDESKFVKWVEEVRETGKYKAVS